MTDTDTLDRGDPYREGFRARATETPGASNPYGKESEDWRAWRAGWLERDRHEAEKNDALDSIGWNE